MRFFNGQWLYLNYTANNYLVIQGFCYFSTLVTYAYTKLKPRGLRVKLAVLGGMGRSCIFAYWKGILTLSQLRKDCSFWALALKVQRKSTEAFLPPRVRKWEVPELNWYIFLSNRSASPREADVIPPTATWHPWHGGNHSGT